MDLEAVTPDDQNDPARAPQPVPPEPRSVFSGWMKVAAAGLGVALVAAAAFAWGSMHSSAATVKLQPASATSTGSKHRPMGAGHVGFGGGVAGTIGTVTTPDFTVTVPAHTWHKPGSSTSGTPAATPATPTTVTVVTGGSTTYELIQNGPVSDAVTGDRILAFGTRSGGDLAATMIRILPPPPAGAKTPTPATGTQPPGGPSLPSAQALANAPFVTGTVATNDGSTITVTTRGGATETITTTTPGTVVVETVPGSWSDIVPGATVSVRGSHQSSGDVTANVVTVVAAGTKDAGPGMGMGMGMGMGGFGHGPFGGRHPRGGSGNGAPAGSPGAETTA